MLPNPTDDTLWTPEAIAERARARASAALAAWLEDGTVSEGDLRDNIHDLITDLGHLWASIPEEDRWEPTFAELVLHAAHVCIREATVGVD